MKALLVVPEVVSNEALRSALEKIATDMTLDLALGEPATSDTCQR
jgi:hypothetical protein